MKNIFLTLKQLLVVVWLFIPGLHLFSQGSDVTINVSRAGSLGTSLTNEQKANTEKLVITTSNGAILNADDFSTLSAMPKLKDLDLSGDLNTKVLTKDAFANNKTLETMKFPGTMNDIQSGVFNNSALKGEVSIPASFTNANGLSGRFVNCQGITAFTFPNNTTLSTKDGVAYTANGTLLLKYPCGKANERFEIPEGVVELRIGSFEYQQHLKTLVLPASCTTLENANCTFRFSSIEAFEVVAGNTKYAAVDGILQGKSLLKPLVCFPAAYPKENVIINGKSFFTIPDSCFSYARGIKRIILTEGVKTIGNFAFKDYTGLDHQKRIEYIQMPASITTINAQAIYGLGNTLKQFVCKSTSVPVLGGNANFRESNYAQIKCSVPESAVSTYKADNNWISYDRWTSAQIEPYHTLTYENCSSFITESVAGIPLEIVADEAPEGESFARWEVTPAGAGTFSAPNSPTTLYIVGDKDATIKAVYEAAREYKVIGSTKTKGGNAAIGVKVNLETDGEKEVEGEWLTFRKWQVESGNVTIDNPEQISTIFTMKAGDEDIVIEAVYGMLYFIEYENGNGAVEAFAGETIEITAEEREGGAFVNWSSEPVSVTFADANAKTTTFVMPESDVTIVANFPSSSVATIEGVQFTLYPNPATDYVALSGVEQGMLYTVYNLLGITEKQGLFDGTPIRLDGMAAGSYILQINSQTVRFVKK